MTELFFEEIIGITNVSVGKSLTSNSKVDVEQHISDEIHISNILIFWIIMWNLILLVWMLNVQYHDSLCTLLKKMVSKFDSIDS